MVKYSIYKSSEGDYITLDYTLGDWCVTYPDKNFTKGNDDKVVEKKDKENDI